MVVSAGAVIVAMPAFLAAASSVLLRADLDFDHAGLGLAISVFFAASACISVIGGRWAERLGGGRTLVLATVGTAFVLLAVATTVQTFKHFIVLLALAGTLNGVAQPAANLALARGVLDHQGFMFGVKQSAIPGSSLVAGAAVPLAGAAVSWESSFILGGLLAAVVATVIPWHLAPPARQRLRTRHGMGEGDAGTAPLVTLSIAAGVGAAAAITLPAFLVESAVERGISFSAGGWLLVAASSASVGGRLVSGWWADRHRGVLHLVPAMLLAGAGGHAMLALGGPVLFTVGALVAYAFGWGWTGLLMYAVVRLNPNAPAVATGIVLTGAAAGASLGPFAFGIAATRLGFDAAWALAGGASVVSAGLLLAARSWLVLDRDRTHDAS